MADGRERLVRDDRIVKLARQGVAPPAIGAQFGLHETRIRSILVGRGVIARIAPPAGEGIWSKPPDKLREAIYRRARDGARRTLDAMEGSGR